MEYFLKRGERDPSAPSSHAFFPYKDTKRSQRCAACLVSVSSTAAVKACPRCNDPVTFGGGMTMTNFSSSSFACKNDMRDNENKVLAYLQRQTPGYHTQLGSRRRGCNIPRKKHKADQMVDMLVPVIFCALIVNQFDQYYLVELKSMVEKEEICARSLVKNEPTAYLRK